MTNETNIKSILVLDEIQNTYYPIVGNDTLQSVVKYFVGKPYKGDIFKLVEQTHYGQIEKRPIPGSDHHLKDTFRGNGKREYKTLETWVWTGKWKQLK
jgi:hypothetical protein